MRIVREHIFEIAGKEGPEWEKLKMIHQNKLNQDFDKFFKIVHNLYLSKIDYIENPEIDGKENYEFIDEGSFEELPQYSVGIWMGTYKNCYSFLHEESGNAYYAKKEEVKEAHEGQMIEVYKAIK